MKRILFFLIVILLTIRVNAQQAPTSIVRGNTDTRNIVAAHCAEVGAINKNGNAARYSGAKTTWGGGRWYDYVDSIFTPNAAAFSTTGYVLFSELPIWEDTSAIVPHAIGYYQNPWTSVGLGFDPFANSWNDPTVFDPSDMAVTPTDNYVIDSISIGAVYGRPNGYSNPDTLIVAFVQGQGSTSTTDDMPGGSFTVSSTTYNFVNMLHDSVNNRAGDHPLISTATGHTATPVTTIYKFLLTPTDTMNGSNVYQLVNAFPRTATASRPRVVADPAINYPVASGYFSGMSVSFKSGAHVAQGGSYPDFPGRDTIRYSGTSGAFKHGGYYPLIAYDNSATIGGVVIFPPYEGSVGDWTSGYFKRETIDSGGWDGRYNPNLVVDSAGLYASRLQYPFISFHVICTTCGIIEGPGATKNVNSDENIIARPNPANDELTISFTSLQNENASVSLTNVLGQVIATQSVTNGKAIFNTSALPAGIYLYVVQADGERTTGRVVIAH